METYLKKRSVRSLDERVSGVRIACVVGLVWVTQEGDARDHVLLPGEEFVAKREGQIVVEALDDSWVTIRGLEGKVA